MRLEPGDVLRADQPGAREQSRRAEGIMTAPQSR